MKAAVRLYIIPVLLLLLAAISILYHLYASDYSFSTLSYYYNKDILDGVRKPMKRGDIIEGEFMAQQNNLGIIAISFDPKYESSDYVTFRLKRSGEKEWYFGYKYYAAQFIDKTHFPFGFPVIADSKNKIYQFELESMIAKSGEGAAIRENYPVVMAKYQFPKNEIIGSADSFIRFIAAKFFTNLMSVDFVFVVIASLLPLFIYVISLISKTTAAKFIGFAPLVFVIFDIFFIRNPLVFPFITISLVLLLDRNKKLLKLLIMLSVLLSITLAIKNISREAYMFYKTGIWFGVVLFVVCLQKIMLQILPRKRSLIIT